MKVTIRDIVNSKDVINLLINSKLKLNISYKMLKIGKFIEEELKLYDTKVNDILKAYCEVSEDGQRRVKDECLDAFNKDAKDLDDLEVDFPFDKIKMSDLDSVEITPAELFRIEYLLEE